MEETTEKGFQPVNGIIIPWLKKIIWVIGVLRRSIVGHQQQSFAGLQSPTWSFSIKVCYSWVQTIFVIIIIFIASYQETVIFIQLYKFCEPNWVLGRLLPLEGTWKHVWYGGDFTLPVTQVSASVPFELCVLLFAYGSEYG